MGARKSESSRKHGVIALDLGGTKIAAGLFDKSGIMWYRNSVPLEGRNGHAVARLLHEQIFHIGDYAAAHGFSVKAIGVSVPGIVYSKTGRVWAPNIRGWKNYPLREEIQKFNKSLRIKIDSDRACSILGEVWQGAAKGCKNAVFLAVGTGIGAGILVDGKVLRGANDIAGAVGWMALDRPFQNNYKGCGCFEYHASGDGLAKVGKEYGKKKRRTRLAGRVTARDLFSAYEQSDPLGKAVLGDAIEFWGMAVANLVSIFNPEKIIFGGGVFGPAKEFLPRIRAEAKKWAQPIAMREVKIEVTRLGPNAALYGAAFITAPA